VVKLSRFFPAKNVSECNSSINASQPLRDLNCHNATNDGDILEENDAVTDKKQQKFCNVLSRGLGGVNNVDTAHNMPQ